jgi:WhiB family redox-sensing transcriptional regulator
VNDWTELAACRGRDQRLWFPRPHDAFAIHIARAVCAGCPVRSTCLAEAMAAPYETAGIWAGTTERERHELARRQARRVS